MMYRIIACLGILVAFNGNAQDEVKQNLYYGNQAFVEGEYEEAAEYYSDAIEVSPLDFKANYNLANAYFRLGEHDKAIERLTAVTSLAPSSYDKSKAFHNLGNAHMMKQDLDGAIEAYKSALRLNPSDEETRYNLAYAQLLKQQQDQQDNQDQGNGEGDPMSGNPDENDGEPQDNENDEDPNESDGNNDTQEGDNGDQESEGSNGDKPKPEDQDGSGQGYSSKLSKEQIDNILDMYYRKEKQVQKKVDKNRRFGYGSPKKKDW